MKRRNFWIRSLEVSLTIVLAAMAQIQSTAEPAAPAPGDNPAGQSDTKAAASPTEGSAQDPALAADTDAPAKMVSNEKPAPPNIKPTGPVAEVIKLANSGLAESVMLAFVTNSSHTFNLGAEEIIYLNDIGVPGSVVTAMIQRDQVLKGALVASITTPPANPQGPGATVAPTDIPLPTVTGQTADQVGAQAMAPTQPYPVDAPPAPPDEGTDEMFYDALSPYGNWVDVEGYGRCWQPTVVVDNSGWQPYFDCGRWVYSDCGWYWLSDYSWGWAPFHYGSWFRHGHLGWCWVPGRTWGPSWVCWRYNDQHCGWAPLPPGATFTAGIGLTFHGHRVGERDDFGLRPAHYHFVAWDHFQDRQLRPSALSPQQVARVYEKSTVATRISGDSHTVINNGLPPSRVAAATHKPMHMVALRDATEPSAIGGRAEYFETTGHALNVYRPSPALASRLPSREMGSALSGGIRAASGQAAPLIVRGAQSSALRESPPPNSLVVIGRGTKNQDQAQARTAAPLTSRPADDLSDAPARTSPAVPSTVARAQNNVSRPTVNQDPEKSWMGTTSSSPQPAWFTGSEASAPTGFNGPAASRPETRGYQTSPQRPSPEVPRYAPAPAYFPQRPYSPPATSAPDRSPSLESRPAPSAPSAPSAPAASSSGSHAHSSDRNGR